MSRWLTTRPELPDDAPDVRRVYREAFPTSCEGDLVESLRQHAGVWSSWVGLVEGQVAGHVVFTPVQLVRGTQHWSRVGLGMIAVRPLFQRHGLGEAMVLAGLADLMTQGVDFVVAKGDPHFYARFGFMRSEETGIHWEWPLLKGDLLTFDLVRGSSEVCRGAQVRFRPEFDSV